VERSNLSNPERDPDPLDDSKRILSTLAVCWINKNVNDTPILASTSNAEDVARLESMPNGYPL
jgi:hypothetical protein